MNTLSSNFRTQNIPTFKIVLCGQASSGKTSFVYKHLLDKFEQKYVATLGVEVHPLRFQTNYGPICFNIWDTAGQEKFGGLREGYYIQAHGAIIFTDPTQDVGKLQCVAKYVYDLDKVDPNMPIIWCENKKDLNTTNVKYNVPIDIRTRVTYINISVKDNYHLHEPLLRLARRLTGKQDLAFVVSKY